MPADESLALVTGGSGYLAGWLIVELLRRGHRVRTTVRNLAREREVRATIDAHVESRARLSFVAADLLADTGWADATADAELVFHVASPMPIGEFRGKDLVTPARDGTVRVLEAAAKAGAKRVVMTSSGVAALPRDGAGDESGWTDATNLKIDEYARSKTVSERAAWDVAERHGIELSTVLPGMILGPVLGRSAEGSLSAIARLLGGKVPALPRVGFGIVDTRDLVDLHIRAAIDPNARGERFLAVNEFLWFSDMARVLKERLGEAARRVPTRRMPDWIVRVGAWLSSDMKQLTPRLGVRQELSHAKAERILRWRPRSAADTLADCGRSIVEAGLA